MPTYTYRRADGTTFELEQRITEAALDTCPTTGQPVRRVITAGAGLVFKGSGFYLTDYARRSSSPSTDSDSAGTAAGATSGDAPAEKAGKAEPASGNGTKGVE
jgi:putative FmdB family regulatory protein